jgi:hypothetical protein
MATRGRSLYDPMIGLAPVETAEHSRLHDLDGAHSETADRGQGTDIAETV